MQVKKSIFSQFYSIVEGNFTKNILKETKKMIKLGTEVPRVKRILKKELHPKSQETIFVDHLAI